MKESTITSRFAGFCIKLDPLRWVVYSHFMQCRCVKVHIVGQYPWFLYGRAQRDDILSRVLCEKHRRTNASSCIVALLPQFCLRRRVKSQSGGNASLRRFSACPTGPSVMAPDSHFALRNCMKATQIATLSHGDLIGIRAVYTALK